MEQPVPFSFISLFLRSDCARISSHYFALITKENTENNADNILYQFLNIVWELLIDEPNAVERTFLITNNEIFRQSYFDELIYSLITESKSVVETEKYFVSFRQF